MRKSYYARTQILLFCLMLLGTLTVAGMAYNHIADLQKREELLIQQNQVLENTVKDMKNETIELIENYNELESKLTDQLQAMDKMKKQYENQLQEKDKAIANQKMRIAELSQSKLKESELPNIQAVSYKSSDRLITVEATAYTARCKGCSGITRLGIDVRKSTPKIIAVDPKVIKLGSKVEVIVDGKSWGTYLAGDTGGAIKGNKVDILMATKSSAYEFGRQKIKVRVIAEPKKEFL